MLRLVEKHIAPITDKLVDGVLALTGKLSGKTVSNIKFEKAVASHMIPFAVILGVGVTVAAFTPLSVAIPAAIVAAVALGFLCHIKLAAKQAVLKLHEKAVTEQTHVYGAYNPLEDKREIISSPLHIPTDEELENKFKELLVADHSFGPYYSGIFIERDNSAEKVIDAQPAFQEIDI